MDIENVGIDNEIVTFSTNWYSTFKNKQHILGQMNPQIILQL